MAAHRIPLPIFRTILFAADFSGRSAAAFRAALSLAKDGATRLIVLHVVEVVHVAEQPALYSEMGLPIPITAEYPAHHRALLDRRREAYTPAHTVAETYLLRAGDAAEEVLRVAGDEGCDLIVMGTHGRGGLGRLLAGSVAEAVMRRAHCPVLTVRSPDESGSPR